MVGATVVFLLAGLAPVADSLPIDDAAWQLQGSAERVDHLGRRAIRLGTGVALRRDVILEDGTIEYDVALNGLRSFAYVRFRMDSDGDYEEIYLRPHKSNLPDAIQYAPVHRGVSSWQLYHGEGFTARVTLPAGGWVRVRLVLRGERAALFVGDAAEPAMVVPRLARGSKGGYLSFRGFVPAGSPAPEAMYVSRIVVRPDEVPVDFASHPVAEPRPSGVVERWSVSAPFALPEGSVTELPAAAMAGPWQTVATEPSGLLVFGRHVRLPEGSRRNAVLARLRISAQTPTVRPLRLGFSDEITVFVNGRPLFMADEAYSENFPRQEGLIWMGQATAFLPLEAGPNEVVIAVTDVFGGWGLMAQLDRQGGVRVEP